METPTPTPETSNWSTLPSDILTLIFNRLNTKLSLLKLRSICTSWRSSLPLSLSPPFSLTVPPPPTPSHIASLLSHRPPTKFSLTQSTIFTLSPLSSSSSSFLLKLSQPNPTKPNSFSLLNPLSLDQIKPPRTFSSLNLLDFRVLEIATTYHLKFADGFPAFNKKAIVVKRHEKVTVFKLSHAGRLEKWTMGDESWVTITGGKKKRNNRSYDFTDVICFRGECYAVDISGILLKFDEEFNPIEIASSMGYSPTEVKYLVPCDNDNDLFLVSKVADPEPEFSYDYEEDDYVLNEETFGLPIRMKVFKMNWKKGDWDYAGKLDDMAFFLGDDVSFSISVRDFDGCRGNCIYLTDQCFCKDEDEDNVYGVDTGFYALDETLVFRLADRPEYAKVFWPPPVWLKKGSSSSRR